MHFARVKLLGFLLPLVAALSLSACDREKQVSYSADVKPILEKHCYECHTEGGPGFKQSGFEMGTYESLMKGTRYGPMIQPGDSLSSNLYRLVAGKADPSIKMPHGGVNPLDRGEIETIRVWIDQGAKDN